MSPSRIVIVGAGQAAAAAIDTLRRKGFTGAIALVGEEDSWPYQRPPLSKKYLAGALAQERLLIRPPHFYADHAIEVHLTRRATHIERGAQRIRLDDGTNLAYDELLLATGSRPRTLAAPGADLPGVHLLRTVQDVAAIRGALPQARRVVVVGGGYIGLEVAATCRELGLDVTVLEMAERTMNRVTCAPVSAFVEAEHARHGVTIVCNTRVQAIAADASTGRARAVVCEDGAEYPAEIIIVGVGVAPADELASAAGLDCANGITVDEFCRTSDPRILAAGDCCIHPSPHYGRRVRLESVDNAFEQGASAALSLLGTPLVHDKVPWFWSDQYDLKLIIVGLNHGYDTLVMRGIPATRSFSACYLAGGELIAIDTVNSAKDQMAARKLIAARARPNLDRLGDPNLSLRDCL
ncbi:MAG TPA: FAD-dependent oxidoreductase [Steroidobacteraceae bacterium]|jgi:3-phenylpropionate/trans-cinnamate dioxygenase ferredoxin reductase subunit|nr:FAD-dependent oxidoreductase [Steroidobacteraceae bacterium]